MDQSTTSSLEHTAGPWREATNLTAAQVWYVAHVYPERVSEHEAQLPYELAVLSEDDRSYWEAAAKVLTELAISHYQQYKQLQDIAEAAELVLQHRDPIEECDGGCLDMLADACDCYKP